ncbi:hypothetical protein GPECTOR_3g396 [Gonium pectorale]|uniref:Uncharacterized protein n=1 Tax=Gonium pectorale TaxID=33097 RepID=A0A150GZB0_GONPE|nr:hypothetical protein GPECTOR_3g396 [Gonium pectorale]|eukprot:KXZ55257.1 hypothetical protein GPECTOR_3g396 [Gonium pectorale]
MDIFEQADVFTPSRAVLQEEEEAAVPSASGYLRPAVCVWNKGLVRTLYPNGLSCDVLLIGSVLAPGVSLAGASLSALCAGGADAGAAGHSEPLLSDQLCCVYSLPERSGSGVLLVCCQYEVARERAAAWARSVLGQVGCRHAVFLGTMAAEHFRGQGDASQEELLFSLRTRAAQQQEGKLPAPLLPTGTVVGGLPAALLSHCQVRSQSAELLVMVEMVAEGRWALLAALAGALRVALQSFSAPAAAQALADGNVLAAARRSLGLGAASEVYA